jgi:hypothetical protein
MKFATFVTVLLAIVAQPVRAHAENTSAGYCEGEFHNPVVVNGFLEWGASDTCSGSASAWYPHTIRVVLQARQSGGYVTVRNANSNPYDSGLATANVFEHNDACVTNAATTYQMKSYVHAGADDWSELSNEATVNCAI